MTRPLLAFFLAGAVGFIAARSSADELNLNGIAQGTGVQTISGLSGNATYSLQCPNLDGGAGQQVFYRAGSAGGLGDDGGVGVGDVLIDFRGQSDPYPITLRSSANLLRLRAFNAADALFCIAASRTP